VLPRGLDLENVGATATMVRIDPGFEVVVSILGYVAPEVPVAIIREGSESSQLTPEVHGHCRVYKDYALLSFSVRRLTLLRVTLRKSRLIASYRLPEWDR